MWTWRTAVSDDFTSRLSGLLEAAAGHDEYPEVGRVLRGARARMRRHRLAALSAVGAAGVVLIVGSYALANAGRIGPVSVPITAAGPTTAAAVRCPGGWMLDAPGEPLPTSIDTGPLIDFPAAGATICRYRGVASKSPAALVATRTLTPEQTARLVDLLNTLPNWDGLTRFCVKEYPGGDMFAVVGAHGERADAFITDGGCEYVTSGRHIKFSTPELTNFVQQVLG
jgi:hypothetical protein